MSDELKFSEGQRAAVHSFLDTCFDAAAVEANVSFQGGRGGYVGRIVIEVTIVDDDLTIVVERRMRREYPA